MATATVTFSLSQISPTTGKRIGTWMSAIEYPVSEIERAEREWADKLAYYQRAEPAAQGVTIFRSDEWQKPTEQEAATRIAAAQEAQLAGLGYGNTWED